MNIHNRRQRQTTMSKSNDTSSDTPPELIRLTRFCSEREYRKYIRGSKLCNNKNHSRYASTSHGFCFSADDPVTAWRYLKGIVSSDRCLILDVDPRRLTVSEARYAGYPSTADTINTCVKTEYCMPQYSRATTIFVDALRREDFATPDEIEALTLQHSLGLAVM